MLDAIADSYSKTEGDIVYDFVQPVALEIERAYQELETMVGEVFPATATGEYLDALALQLTGLVRITGESDDAFRTKVLAALGAPAGAGSQRDYRTWLADVPGLGPVTAFSSGAGTVSVFVVADDHTVAGSPLVSDAQDVLDVVSPVTAAVTAVAASLSIDGPFTLTLTGSSAAQVTTWTAAVQAYFDSLHPGDSFNLYELLAQAEIPASRYVSHDFDGNDDVVITATAGQAFHASPVTIES